MGVRRRSVKRSTADLEACFSKAWTLLDSGKHVAGFRLLLETAERGHVASQSGVGYLYDVGRGVRRSPTRALRWYRLAARQGDLVAANNLGTVFRDRGSRRPALRWFWKAVALGDSDALLEIARLEAAARGGRRRAVRHLRQLLRREDSTESTREDAQALLVELQPVTRRAARARTGAGATTAPRSRR